MIEIVQANADIVRDFYGHNPPNTLWAWAIVRDGETLAVGGLVRRGQSFEIFSDLRPEAKRYPKTLVKTARIILDHAKERGRPVFALRNPEEPTADNFLRHLGFEPQGEIYRWRS